MNTKKFFDKFSGKATKVTGSSTAFIVACAMILVWVVTGPVFHFSDTWQLVINTGTTIITFLMVFVIQQTQNKDTLAVHLKLNELIAANAAASNRLIDVEDLTEEELKMLKTFYVQLTKMAKKEANLNCSHTIEDAALNTHLKMKKFRKESELVKKDKGVARPGEQ